MIDGKNFFDQPINSNFKTYENIRNIATGQGDDYTTSCLLDYSYFKDHYRMIAIDLSKQNLVGWETQQCSLLLKKQKKLFWTFLKEL